MEQNDVTVTADVKPLRVDRRRTLLTTTCADRRAVYAKYVYSASTGWDKVPGKTTLSFKDTEFSYKTAYTGRSEHLCQKISWIRSPVSTELRLVTDKTIHRPVVITLRRAAAKAMQYLGLRNNAGIQK